MSKENTWAPAQSFVMGTVKVGGDAVKVEDSKEEDKDDDKQKSNGEDSES
jgi:hypothetical protein